MSGIDRARLKELLNEKGRSARDVSLKADLGETAVKQILNGKNKKPSLEVLLAVAAELGVSLGDFADLETAIAPVRFKQLVPAYLPVRYHVAAGIWRSVDEYLQDYPEPENPVVPDRRYAEWPQWLEAVEGASMNLLLPEGSFAHVVDAIEMGYAAKTGDVVIVECRRDGGMIRERTVKQVKINGRGIELWPRSSDPKYQEPLILSSADESMEIEIVGKVIGNYSSFS